MNKYVDTPYFWAKMYSGCVARCPLASHGMPMEQTDRRQILHFPLWWSQHKNIRSFYLLTVSNSGLLLLFSRPCLCLTSSPACIAENVFPPMTNNSDHWTWPRWGEPPCQISVQKVISFKSCHPHTQLTSNQLLHLDHNVVSIYDK